MPAPTPEELHARAERLLRAAGTVDPISQRFAASVTLALDGDVVRQRRALNWITSLHEYEEHWRRVGRTPRENTRARATLSDDERNLGEWARYQRRFEEQLNTYQRCRLDVSPAFEWDPLETLWHAQFAAVVQFVDAHGQLPRLHAGDRVEFVLARWLGRQLRRLQMGLLDQNRADAIHRLLRSGRSPRR